MAPDGEPKPTYHVVPRFDMAARGGPLELGTVVDGLQMLRPLNRGKVAGIDKNLRYRPVVHGGFTETRSRLREGHGGIWAKALIFQGVGLSADAAAQHETQSTVACDALVTTYFDPDEGYVARSLAARGVSDFFRATGYKKDVYMVTGLKVAKKLRYNATAAAQQTANIQGGVQEPNTGTQLGANAGGAANDEYRVEFEVDDIVVGYRVRRYAYVPASSWNVLSNKKKLEGTDYLTNAKLYEDGDKGIKGPEVTYKQVPVEEEKDAQVDTVAATEESECWVDPTK